MKIPRFGLANVVAGAQVVPELLQEEVNPRRLGEELAALLDPAVAAGMRAELGKIRAHLGQPGAAGRVADHVISRMVPLEPA